MISQRKIMYHMARSPRPPCHARNLMPPKPGDDHDRQSRNYCESRRRRRRCTIARRSSPRTANDNASVIFFAYRVRLVIRCFNDNVHRRAVARTAASRGSSCTYAPARRPPGARPGIRAPRRRSAAHRYRGRFLILLGSRAVAGALFASSGLVRAGLLSLAAGRRGRGGAGAHAQRAASQPRAGSSLPTAVPDANRNPPRFSH